MRTSVQVEVIVFRRDLVHGRSYLLLKRTPQKGGFWQPITGGVESNEAIRAAAMRELQEETGIQSVRNLVDTEFSFAFSDNGRDYTEHVFAAEIEISSKITLSSEHTDFKWVTADEALNTYLKWPGNKAGLRALMALPDA